VRVGTYRAALDVCDRPTPQDPYGGKFSLQHTVAAALMDGRVDQASFDSAARARLARERAKITLEISDEIDAAYPKSWGAHIQVTTTGGRSFSAMRHDAKGDPDNPVTAAELSLKARGLLAEGGMATGEADAFIAAVLDLPRDRPVRDLKLFARQTPQIAATRRARRA
jgi:2-methylcitrate dehydratase PrpD